MGQAWIERSNTSYFRSELEVLLRQLELPDGGNLMSRDMVRAVRVEADAMRFVPEAPSPEMARMMEPLRAAGAPPEVFWAR